MYNIIYTQTCFKLNLPYIILQPRVWFDYKHIIMVCLRVHILMIYPWWISGSLSLLLLLSSAAMRIGATHIFFYYYFGRNLLVRNIYCVASCMMCVSVLFFVVIVVVIVVINISIPQHFRCWLRSYFSTLCVKIIMVHSSTPSTQHAYFRSVQCACAHSG